MKKMIILAVTMLAAAVTSRAATLAGPIVNPANGHTYYLLTTDTWQNSELQAVALGGHLATINDQAEQTWVFSTFGSYGGVNRSLWLGLREVGAEGNYQWVSQESLTYTHWNRNQPDNANGTESYVHMINVGNVYGHPGGEWNDLRSPNTDFSTFNPLCGVVEVPAPRMTIQVACVDICWASASNKTYQVQYRSSLTTNLWTDFGTPIAGIGGTNCISDAVQAGHSQRFYRVTEKP
jgi:hypothetical protein